RHLVGAGRLGDGIDPNRPYSLSVKQIARSRQDPRAGWNSLIFSLACLISDGHGTFPLDTGVTGQYLFRCYRSVPQGEATVTCFSASQFVRSDSHEPSRSHRATKPGSRAARRPERTVLTLSPR